MVNVISALPQFFAVLIATLIGVYSAFLLDHWQQEQKTRKRACDHLHSIKSEVKTNLKRAEANDELIRQLQQRNPEGDHYILEPFETDAWEAAMEEPIIGTVSGELYRELQSLYSRSKLVNSYINNQRDEMHHHVIGEEGGRGSFSYEIWTISVDFYDHDKEKVDYTGLGPLIRNEANSIKSSKDIIKELEEEIERLQEYPLQEHLVNTLGS